MTQVEDEPTGLRQQALRRGTRSHPVTRWPRSTAQPAEPAELATKVFTTSDSAAIKGMKRVALPSFQVEFVTRSSAQASTSGFASAGHSSVSAHYTLVGVGEADFQALTNQLHADFVRDLQQMGVEVVPFSQVQASPAYRISRLSSTASVDGKVQPALLAGSSMMAVQSATTRTTVMLRNPLVFPPAAISGLREATSTATQVGNVAAVLINLAAGGKNSSSAADFEAVAEPADYRASTGASLGQVREMLVSRLKAEQ